MNVPTLACTLDRGLEKKTIYNALLNASHFQCHGRTQTAQSTLTLQWHCPHCPHTHTHCDGRCQSLHHPYCHTTHAHCTWSLCDHCTIHTATHSLSNVIVDCSHVLQHMAIVDTDCTIHTDTHSLSTVNVKIFQYLLLAHSFQFGAYDN